MSSDSEEEEAQPRMDYFREMFAKLNFKQDDEDDDQEPETPEKLLNSLTLDGIVEYIKSDKCKQIVVMCGAGISTAAGIPDFRSPGTGLYDNLQKYDLPNPQAIFELDYFKENPNPFFALAKELYPGKFKPTYSHYFMKILEQKDLLQRVYTQNIDTLEHVANISADKIVEAHGTFSTAHCIGCRLKYSQEWMREKIFRDEIPRCTKCGQLVKPDIVFFGEGLPMKFFALQKQDFPESDLLLIMGTSLRVQPFADLTGHVSKTTPRVLINREKCGVEDVSSPYFFFGSSGLDFDSEKAYRDVALLGSCDDMCRTLAEKLGWKDELDDLIKKEHERIDDEAREKAKKDLAKKKMEEKLKTAETNVKIKTAAVKE